MSYVRTTANGRPAVLVNVIQQPSANTIAIAGGIDALLAGRPELLPKDVLWTTFYDQAEFISHSVHGARDAIVIGVVLAAFVVLLFLRRFRPTLVAVATIPVSVALVMLGLAATGQTINLMTLGGIAAALGLVVDDAIVVVENIHRHRESRLSEHPAESGLAEILPALLASSLSTIVVFAPFALLTGIVGAFFKPLALTMALSLGVSFLLAAFAVPPALGADRPPAGSAGGTPRPSAFRRLPAFLTAHGWVARLATLLLLGAGGVLYARIGTDFLPNMDEGSVILDYWSPPGTSLTDTDGMLREVEKIIVSLPDVESYSRRTGTQLGFFITEPNRGRLRHQAEAEGTPPPGRRGHRRPSEPDRGRRTGPSHRFRTAPRGRHRRPDGGRSAADRRQDLRGGSGRPRGEGAAGREDRRRTSGASRTSSTDGSSRGRRSTFASGRSSWRATA